MKIIGEAGDSVIIHATKDEFAQMAGFHSEYSLGRDGTPPAKAGATLPVGQLYRQATELVTWYREFKSDLLTNHKRLTKLLEIIDPSKTTEAK